jgi:hypothetical protein
MLGWITSFFAALFALGLTNKDVSPIAMLWGGVSKMNARGWG